MGKLSINKIFTAVIITSLMGIGRLYAQGPIAVFDSIEQDSIFTWKLIEVADPSTQSTFNFKAQPGITVVSWNFGDTNTSTDASPNHTYNYTNWDDSITVTLSYTLNGSNLTHSRELPLSPAYFWILPDFSLGRLASFKKIFISNYKIGNDNTELGDLHFAWTIDGVALTGNEFIPATLGQWPNIYYTFSDGGSHQVKLEVYNTNTPANVAEFTKTINILPDFTATKEKLVNVPNVFTPNGDGNNDYFEVQTSGTARFVIRILSRSGALLYQEESSLIRWDGKNSQGKVLPEGIYYYIIEDLTNQYESATGFVYIYTGDK